MPDILTIDLRNQIPGGGGVEFLRAETSAKYRTPFVLVWYALNGKEQKEGLRLDLDKRAFLDHFEDSSREATAVKAAHAIAEFVGDVLYRRGQSHDGRHPSSIESPTS